MDNSILFLLLGLALGLFVGGAVGATVFFRRGREIRDIGEENVMSKIRLAEEAWEKEKAREEAQIERERSSFQKQMRMEQLELERELKAERAEWKREYASQDRSLQDRKKHLQRTEDDLAQREEKVECSP